MSDLIDRQAAIDALWEIQRGLQMIDASEGADITIHGVQLALHKIEQLPSAQPTIYGYNVKHLELIAGILQKENMPPERVVEALTNIGRIVASIQNEFQETLKKAVEQCMI